MFNEQNFVKFRNIYTAIPCNFDFQLIICDFINSWIRVNP